MRVRDAVLNDSPLVSVIVPVYNSQQYVAHAVRSILRQSYSNIEVILVDDGSTDTSGDICDQCAAGDSRVVVVHKENGGICSARNAGLDIARGEFLAFCDNDDEYLPGLIQENVELAIRLDVDVVRFLREHLIVLDGAVLRRDVLKSMSDELVVLSADLMGSDYYQLYRYGCGVWTGLYRRSVIECNHIRFPQSMRFGYEDLYFNLLVSSATSSFAINPHIYYRWVDRYEHSTSRKFSTNRLDSLRKCLRLEGKICDKHGLSAKNPAAWATYFIDTYAMRFLQQLTVPTCNISWSEKVHQLLLFAEEPVTRQTFITLSTYAKQLELRHRVIASLLRHRSCAMLLAVFSLNARLRRRVY